MRLSIIYNLICSILIKYIILIILHFYSLLNIIKMYSTWITIAHIVLHEFVNGILFSWIFCLNICILLHHIRVAHKNIIVCDVYTNSANVTVIYNIIFIIVSLLLRVLGGLKDTPLIVRLLLQSSEYLESTPTPPTLDIEYYIYIHI